MGLVLAYGPEMPCSTKVELSGASARQGKETVHLVGNRTSWWDDRAGTDVLVDLAAVVVHDSPGKGNDNGRLDKKLIKCLMGSVDDLSGYMPIRTTSTWDYGVCPPHCGIVRKI